MGVGNILLGDEGIGVHAIKAMQGLELPSHVELMDGGTASLDLLYPMRDREKVIIIDAVKGDDKPGTIYRFTPQDITIHKSVNTSMHEVDLMEAITLPEFMGGVEANIVIYGVQPKSLDWSLELTPEVAEAIPKLIKAILKEI
jgi:hydrogenase maturation protease